MGGRRAINQQVKDVLGIFVPLYTCMYRCKTITKVQRMIRLTGFRVLRSFSLNAILIFGHVKLNEKIVKMIL